jgi:hypothetical protein
LADNRGKVAKSVPALRRAYRRAAWQQQSPALRTHECALNTARGSVDGVGVGSWALSNAVL